MIKKLFFILFVFAFIAANAQTKKPTTGKGKGKGKNDVAVVDTTGPEPELSPMEKLELELPLETEIDPMTGKKVFYKERKVRNDSIRRALALDLKKKQLSFWVKTKYPKPKTKDRIQLCINIANKDTNLTFCLNDSICKDPETVKVLFEQTKGDTTYMLIFIEAFTKMKNDGGLCNGGRETKLFFVRWNYKVNKATWKFKNICSCAKGITNMTKEPIKDWDKSGPLTVSYHRAATFYEIKFDPQKPELGIQSNADEAK